MESDFLSLVSNSNSPKDYLENSHFVFSIESKDNDEDGLFFNDANMSFNTDSIDVLSIKVCSVCGDKALGYNFGAITCESCKAFFRRNALKSKVPPCAFDRHCIISISTRKFCTFCRLKKCFEFKMKKENILGESSKHKRSKNNHGKNKTDSSFSFDCESSQSSSTDTYCYSSNNREHHMSQYNRQLVSKYHFLPPNITNSCANVSTEMQYVNRCSTLQRYEENSPTWNPTVITSVLKHSRLVSLNDKLSREGQARLLSQEEWNTLSSIYKSYIENFIDSGSMPPSAMENVSLSNLVNSSGFIVRKLINFAKCQSEFTSLEQPYQITLLKGAVLNSLILRSAVEYDVAKKSWITPQGEISLELIKSAGLFELYDDYATYCTTLKKLMGSDNYLISLMQILCLFCFDNSSLTDRQMISDIHDKYMILLKHYLEAVYGFSESRFINISILNNIIELYRLTAKHGQILLHVDPTNVDPLMLEVFNMSLSNSLKNLN